MNKVRTQDPPPFEEIEHTADLSLRVTGQSLEELFVHAAQGMFDLMRCRPLAQASPLSHAISLHSPDLETLLVDWLNELLYLSERDRVCYQTFEFSQMEPTALSVFAQGLTPYFLGRGIKAATFFGLEVTRDVYGYYEATIVFDV